MVNPERCLRDRSWGVVSVGVGWVELKSFFHQELEFYCPKSEDYTLGLGHFVITVDASGKI